MIAPSKFTPFKDSIICKMLKILELRSEAIGIIELYDKVGGEFSNIDEYMYSIDVLYVLGHINVDLSKGVIEYADRNSL